MTLSEAIELAKQGDHNAICTVGSYFLNGEEGRTPDYDEAKRWYILGAEKGYEDCMYIASIVGCILGHTIIKIGGSYAALDAISELETALYWAREAAKKGVAEAKAQEQAICEELGIAHYFAAIAAPDYEAQGEISVKHLREAIALLKPLYNVANNKEVLIFLALSLEKYGAFVGRTEDNDLLEHKLLSKCVDEHFDTLIHTDIAACHLGVMYMDGRGCKINYDKAVFYFQKAHNAGFDCSELLSLFKKKWFGGYTLK